MKNSYLSINNLNFEYPDGFKALHNINFQIKKNEKTGQDINLNTASHAPLRARDTFLLGFPKQQTVPSHKLKLSKERSH